jgi:hypothetical protein
VREKSKRSKSFERCDSDRNSQHSRTCAAISRPTTHASSSSIIESRLCGWRQTPVIFKPAPSYICRCSSSVLCRAPRLAMSSQSRQAITCQSYIVSLNQKTYSAPNAHLGSGLQSRSQGPWNTPSSWLALLP